MSTEELGQNIPVTVYRVNPTLTGPVVTEQQVEYYKKLEQIAHLVGTIHFAGNFKVETHSEAALDELLKQVGAHYTTWEQCEQGTEKFKTNKIEYVWNGVRKVWG